MTVKKIKYGMKVLINIRGRRWLHLIFMILVAQSCDQWIDPEINVFTERQLYDRVDILIENISVFDDPLSEACL